MSKSKVILNVEQLEDLFGFTQHGIEIYNIHFDQDRNTVVIYMQGDSYWLDERVRRPGTEIEVATQITSLPLPQRAPEPVARAGAHIPMPTIGVENNTD